MEIPYSQNLNVTMLQCKRARIIANHAIQTNPEVTVINNDKHIQTYNNNQSQQISET